jgi:UDP-N-acetylglucosamine:LPS N-acetylglucosamine transferase
MLVCSPGGHLLEMRELARVWDGLEVSWVTLPGADVDALLTGQDVTIAHGPTNRSLRKLVQNVALAWREVRRRRPAAILSTGAALAVPFFLIGRMHGIRTVYVESLTRTQSLSLSGRMVYPLASSFFVQWPGATSWKRARYVGNIL